MLRHYDAVGVLVPAMVGRGADVPDRGALEWASHQGLAYDMSERAGAEHWASRLEIYFTDPSQEPDMDKWETQLAFKLAGPPGRTPTE